MSELLMEFTSQIAGSKTSVAVYDDRIEWAQDSWRPSMIRVSQIQRIGSHRAGMRFTVVHIATAADVTEFRVTRARAEKFRATIVRLMPGGPHAEAAPPAPAQAAPPAAAPAESLTVWQQPRVRDAIAAARRRRDDRADD